MINGFVHSSGDMEIIVDNMDPDLSLVANKTIKVGDSGKVQGDGKLYVSYAEMEQANGSFAGLVMGNKDYVIGKNGYYVTVSGSDISFDQTIASLNLSVPFIMDIDVAEVNLHSNRLQVDISSFRLDEIIDSTKKSLQHKTGANKESEPITKRSSLKQFGAKEFFGGLDGSLSMAITPDGIQFGGEVTLSVDDKINFGTFGINELSLKLNSLDPDYEYWKIGGKIDLATSIPGFFDSRIAGFDVNDFINRYSRI